MPIDDFSFFNCTVPESSGTVQLISKLEIAVQIKNDRKESKGDVLEINIKLSVLRVIAVKYMVVWSLR